MHIIINEKLGYLIEIHEVVLLIEVNIWIANYYKLEVLSHECVLEKKCKQTRGCIQYKSAQELKQSFSTGNLTYLFQQQ